jgi:cobalamin biosynthesis Mg chelatase CobN
MHLLSTQPGRFVEDDSVVTRLDQTPGDIVVLSSADTTLALLAAARTALAATDPGYPSLRLANLMYLRQPASLDLYVDEVLQHARVVVVDHLGAESAWAYGLQQLEKLAKRKGQQLAMFSGDLQEDEDLLARGTVPRAVSRQLWQYMRAGGAGNAMQFLRAVAFHGLGHGEAPLPPRSLPQVALHVPRGIDAAHTVAGIDDLRAGWHADAPVVALVFYRSHLLSGNTAAFDALAAALHAEGLNPLPVALDSLKDPLCLSALRGLCSEHDVQLVLNTTAFAALGQGAQDDAGEALALAGDAPVLQVIVSGGNREDWLADSQGLRPRDIAMQIALPEMDGRIITRAVSFKGLSHRCELTQTEVVNYQPEPDRIAFVAELARRWCRLRSLPVADKRIALILANYPGSEGRIGSGVGLDTPASVIAILRAMQAEGYALGDAIPADGDALMQKLQEGIANDPGPMVHAARMAELRARRLPRAARGLARRHGRRHRCALGHARAGPDAAAGPLHDRRAAAGPRVRRHPARTRTRHARRGGLRELPRRRTRAAAQLPGVLFLAARRIRHRRGRACRQARQPRMAAGQEHRALADLLARRHPRAAAERLPLHRQRPGRGRAGQAAHAGGDRRPPDAAAHARREPRPDAGPGAPGRRVLRRAAGRCAARQGAARADPRGCAGAAPGRGTGHARRGRRRRAGARRCLPVRAEGNADPRRPACVRRFAARAAAARHAAGVGALSVCRWRGRECRVAGRAGATCCRAIAFDPLDIDAAKPWQGARPALLQSVSADPWRHQGDTRERLELLAQRLLEEGCPEGLPHTAAVMRRIEQTLAPALDACGTQELLQLCRALQGRFVPPGPSGSPSRGRPDVLPTGRNFYAVDTRAIPTPTAWMLGLKSAAQLVERHMQEHGDYPVAMGLSVWGTATMRTGGDDLAQAFALIGVRPKWAPGSQRVVDFEVLPTVGLGRPRIDVTLRISGFFRDAFPNAVQMFDAAVQAVASQEDEDAERNPIRARILREAAALEAQGHTPDAARTAGRLARVRLGAGQLRLGPAAAVRPWRLADRRRPVQRLCRRQRPCLRAGQRRRAGGRRAGAPPACHERRLQNQDSREHDLLDSNDYYQFQGGMAAAVRHLSGQQPAMYHGDHGNPQAPRVRTLKEEISRVIRARVVNPKWIDGVKRHGYKGAFEMAATVDYLFGFDATARVVGDHQYAMVADAYVLDADTRDFVNAHNPRALQDMLNRLLEAMQRGLWQSPGAYKTQLENLLLDHEQQLEGTEGSMR